MKKTEFILEERVIGVGDVFVYRTAHTMALDHCYLVREILSVGQLLTLMVSDICSYDELSEITKSDIENNKVGGDPIYLYVSLDTIHVVAHVQFDDNDYYSEKTKTTVDIDGTVLEFGIINDEKEAEAMETGFVQMIINTPSLAKHFIEVYRDNDIDKVSDMFDIPEKSVEKTVDKIKQKYRVSRTDVTIYH